MTIMIIICFWISLFKFPYSHNLELLDYSVSLPPDFFFLGTKVNRTRLHVEAAKWKLKADNI